MAQSGLIPKNSANIKVPAAFMVEPNTNHNEALNRPGQSRKKSGQGNMSL